MRGLTRHLWMASGAYLIAQNRRNEILCIATQRLLEAEARVILPGMEVHLLRANPVAEQVALRDIMLGTLAVIDPATGSIYWQVAAATACFGDYAWSPTGRHLATAFVEMKGRQTLSRIRLYAAANGAIRGDHLLPGLCRLPSA